ncbi:hypothetical protein RND81_11G090400 [Saponaria officinalis]|uniref:Uncharacterized protein n=1 Tax=Saponaria officinalis TaxID=3572 RepID=A0AAW1HLJ7_SAPOF
MCFNLSKHNTQEAEGPHAWKRTSPIMTRSVAQNIAKSKPRKNRRKREQTVLPKLYEIPGTSGGHYTDLTPEEYIACQKEHENFMLTAYLEKDPDYDKRQADDLSRQFFLNIQASRKEVNSSCCY